MTAPQRLLLLLPLANGDPLSPKDLRQALRAFLGGFEAPGLRLPRGAGMLEPSEVFIQRNAWAWEAYKRATEAELKAVQRKVKQVFDQIFLFDDLPLALEEFDDMVPPLKFPTLRLGALRGKPGARFTLMADAEDLRDLVPFLVIWLLTAEQVAVSRCSAPQRENWSEVCNRLVIWKGIGRPREYCDEDCLDRGKKKQKHDEFQKWKAEKKAEKEAKAMKKKKTSTRKGTQR